MTICGFAFDINLDSGSDTYLNTYSGIETIIGGDGDDTLTGDGNTNRFEGGSGNDLLDGGSGSDTLDGGAGQDSLDGGAGDDYLFGGDARDYLYLSAGNDTLIGGADLSGYDALDTTYATSSLTVTWTSATAGTVQMAGDTTTFSKIGFINAYDWNGTVNASIWGTSDYYDASGADGSIQVQDYQGGADTVIGSEFGDLIDLFGWSGMSLDGANVAAGAGDDIISLEDGGTVSNSSVTVDGGAGNDSIYFNSGDGVADVLGGSGNDTIFGADAAMTVRGGTGDDLIRASDKDDTFILEDGFGNDTIFGDEGDETSGDTLDFSALTSSGIDVTFSAAEAGSSTDGVDTITFSQIENLVLSDQNDTVDGMSSTAGISVDGKDGNDSLIGSDLGDTIAGGAGDDYIEGGLGDDFLTTGEGQDTLLGGQGNDKLMNSDGDDSLDGGAGDDSIVATGGEDTLRGGTGDDYMDGGNDADTFIIEDNFGNDTIIGGEGVTDGTDRDFDTIDLSMMTGPVTVTYTGDEADTITNGTDTITFSEIERVIATDQDDVVDGTAQYPGLTGDAPGMNVETRGGNDSVFGGRGGDTIDAGTGDDSIDGDYGDDSIEGGDGNDTLVGSTGNDTLSGGDGNDSLNAGVEGDTLEGGAGDDTITGGDGDDLFIYNVGDGSDTITDFNSGNSGALNDGDTTNNDFIDLSGFYGNIFELREDFNDDGVLNQSNSTSNGGTVDYSDNDEMQSGDGITFSGADQSSFTADNTGVVCFTSGTAIRTPRGDVLIDDLRVGDLVTTMDNGPQRIAWIGQRHVSHAELVENDRLHPVLIKRGVLGAERNLLVSRQHGMLQGQDRLGRAIHLSKTMPGVRVAKGKRKVTYVHLMLEAHQIIFAEGIPSESFYPSPMALEMLNTTSREEMLQVFPKLCGAVHHAHVTAVYGSTARRFLENRKAVETWLRDSGCPIEKEVRKWDLDIVMEQQEAKRLIAPRAQKQVRYDVCKAS